MSKHGNNWVPFWEEALDLLVLNQEVTLVPVRSGRKFQAFFARVVLTEKTGSPSVAAVVSIGNNGADRDNVAPNYTVPTSLVVDDVENIPIVGAPGKLISVGSNAIVARVKTAATVATVLKVTIQLVGLVL